MSNDTTYNGWTNYQTWVWKLWIDNEEGWYESIQEAAQRAIDDTSADEDYDGQTHLQAATSALAEYMESDADEMQELMGIQTSGPFADLLTHAIGQINWHEIAENILGDMEFPEPETDDEADEDE